MDGQTDRSITFREFTQLVQAVGSGLYRQGFKKGDVICLFAGNCVEYAVIFHAVAAIGGILTPCNPLYTIGNMLS